MGWLGSLATMSHGFGSITSRVSHAINTGVHAVTGTVQSVVHTVETGAQHAVSGAQSVVHTVASATNAGVQGALSGMRELGVPQFIRGIETSLVHDTDIPNQLNSGVGALLGGTTGLIVGAGAILAVLILK